jgi:hypothetical protein
MGLNREHVEYLYRVQLLKLEPVLEGGSEFGGRACCGLQL